MSNENNHTIIVQLVVDKKHTPLEISHIVRKAMQENNVDPYKIDVMSEDNFMSELLGEAEDPGVPVEFNDFFKSFFGDDVPKS